MQVKTIPTFDNREVEIVESLIDLGTKPPVAKIIVYLSTCTEPQTSRMIETVCNLRQPEVSNAMSGLIEQLSVVEVTERQIGGKGRPIKMYTMTKTLKGCVDMFEYSLKAERQMQREKIAHLRGLVNETMEGKS